VILSNFKKEEKDYEEEKNKADSTKEFGSNPKLQSIDSSDLGI